ncbi:START domain-containing protein [Dyadobacter sp. CY323]|uniref:START domain-containing protein n=1 Tax=Dyadobacter sp. CY323 TaxID=2907302 RepID=UPI001F24C1D4|nr:START domain-containing protein [Dyadobacter sp. CY323]MCE6989652.1 START domain-containing protein [Dyadobacter sp. CY323]
MKNLIVVISMLSIQFGVAFGQAAGLPQWKYVSGKEDIKVYSKAVPNSKIKALKAECMLDATTQEVIDLLLDIPAAAKWVCHAKSCVLLRKISDRELYYYTEVSLPWPLDNRDFVTHLKIWEDPETKIVTVNAPAVPGFVNEKKGKVRVRHSIGTWKIIPAGDKKVKVEYILQVDPGGLIPAHIVNMFATQAPIETFINMKRELLIRRSKNA